MPTTTRRRRTKTATPDFPVVARMYASQADAELAETLRLLERRAKRMTDLERKKEMRFFFNRHNSLRDFPGLTLDDKIGRCLGCNDWLVAKGTGGGREGIPPEAAGKIDGRPVCGRCKSGAAG